MHYDQKSSNSATEIADMKCFTSMTFFLLGVQWRAALHFRPKCVFLSILAHQTAIDSNGTPAYVPRMTKYSPWRLGDILAGSYLCQKDHIRRKFQRADRPILVFIGFHLCEKRVEVLVMPASQLL